jgi:F-type H+-transporting ATPase subunit delta
MANNSTLSRPYAQALFEHSGGWSSDLEKISLAVRDTTVANLIDSPHLSYQDKVKQFLALFEGEIEPKSVNFLTVLGESKRLSLLPDIEKEYRALIESNEGKKTVELFSPFVLSPEQQDKITTSLKKRFGDNLTVESGVDESLIGGFLARSGDDVLDASIKGKLEKLSNQLT